MIILYLLIMKKEEKKQDSKRRADVVLHPVRLRILTTLSGRSMTPGQIAGKLPDVPQATLYRHLKRLEEGDIIQVEETHHVRGTLEKVYGPAKPEDMNFSEDDMKNVTPSEHEQYFTAFIAGLLDQFQTLTEAARKEPKLMTKMGYHTHPVNLHSNQLPHFQRDLAELLQRYTEETTQCNRTEEAIRFNLTTIFLPEVEDECEY